MQADYAVEAGRKDAALELPWKSEDAATRYYDLKNHPEQIVLVPEASDCPELRVFLTRINAQGFRLETVKCDAWFTRDLAVEDEIFGSDGKFVSYVDIVFAGKEPRLSFEKHEGLAKRLCTLLKNAPEMPAAVEMVIRRCYFHSSGNPGESESGFSITIYTAGFGDDEPQARKRWSIALTLLQHALVQVAQ